MTFTVLHVCLGNICRSPMAERILRHELERRFGAAAGGVICHSAGTYAGISGDPMNRQAAAALRRLGVDASGFLARGLEPWMAADADLVLTATRDQSRRLVASAPDAGPRTFTLRELAALAASLGSPDRESGRPIRNDVPPLRIDRSGGTSLRDQRPHSWPPGALEQRLAALVRSADAARRDDPGRVVGDLDVADPYGEPDQVFDATADQISAAVKAILDALS